MPTHHALPAVLLRWIYEHVWRFRAVVVGAVADDAAGAEARVRALFPRSARKLICVARSGTLELAPPPRADGARPVPPFDLEPLGLPGVLRVFVYPHEGGLRVAVATKAGAVASIVAVTRFLSAALGRPVGLRDLVDDSREFFVTAPRFEVKRAVAQSGSWLGPEDVDRTFVVLATWRGAGTDAAERLFVSVRWYSYDKAEAVKIEVRLGAHHRKRGDVSPWDLRRGALIVLQSIVIHEGLHCGAPPTKWKGRPLPAGPGWLGDAELRVVTALAEMDREAPLLRLHPLAELSSRAGLSRPHATEVLGRLAGWGLLTEFKGANPKDKRRKFVRVGDLLALYAAVINPASASVPLPLPPSVVRPFYSSSASQPPSPTPRDAAGEADHGSDGGGCEVRDPQGLGVALDGPRRMGTLRVPANHGHGPSGRCRPRSFKTQGHPIEAPAVQSVAALLAGEISPIVPVCPSSEPEEVARALLAACVPSPTGLDWTAESVLAAAARGAPRGTGPLRGRGR